jgi:methylenetetrahydrofolate reductase (NADPH)
MRMSGLACSALLEQNNIEAIYQLTCRDRNLLALQSDLLGAKAFGIKNILTLTGDPVSAGDNPHAKGVFQMEAVGLLNLISKMNQGLSSNDKKLDGDLGLFPGAAVNPGHSLAAMEAQLKRMEKKMTAGAQFFQTQIIFDRDQMETFMKRARPMGAKVIAGVLLVTSLKTAHFLNNKVPGIFVPEEMLKNFESAKDQEKMGIELASKLARDYFDICDGVHLISIKKEELIIEIIREAGFGHG